MCDHVAHIHGVRLRASRDVFQSEVSVSEIEEGIFEPLWAVGDIHLDDDHRNGGRTADGLRELRSYVCVLPSDVRATAVDAPGLDIGVAKDINRSTRRAAAGSRMPVLSSATTAAPTSASCSRRRQKKRRTLLCLRIFRLFRHTMF